MYGGWRWRRGRPTKPRIIRFKPAFTAFIPSPSAPPHPAPIVLTLDELEAVRLVDYQGLLQEEAAKRMGISRGTLWRLLERARRKMVGMIVEGRPLIVSPDGGAQEE